MVAIHTRLSADNRLSRLRAEQARHWFWSEVQTVLNETILTNTRLAGEAASLESSVVNGVSTPYAAARNLLASILSP
jgi:putative protein kinase ArgK-like GTPase of G3E family